MNVFGLIGHPLTHSFSKQYFDKKFQIESLTNAKFELFDIENIQLIHELIKGSRLKGLAVTIPYKQQILPFLFYADEIVTSINACNCIKIVDGKLYGFNTDVIGFEQSFIQHLSANHQQALVLGNGGAAVAIKYVLNKLNISCSLVTRNKSNGSLSYEELNEEIISNHQIIINTTPLGTFPQIESCPDIPYHFITSQHYLFDVVYNPAETSFMQRGKQQKAIVKNGYEMLCLQAEENWRIWNSN